ncbi:MAG TPA: hypothetical protein QF359_06440, partial [Rhodospirillales bacterium]|nr:hypothetical protein [Rhodospirillales bacterium]
WLIDSFGFMQMKRHCMQKWILPLLVALMTLPILSACGKKSELDKPPGKEPEYPRKYPGY